jgi:hydrogenase maturation protease
LNRPLILCLGNEVLTDDGFGAVVANRLASSNRFNLKADIIFAPLAGFGLIDLLSGRERVLIIDTIQTGINPPGTLTLQSAGVFTPSNHLTASHQINLPIALKLADLLNLKMPRQIEVLTVEAEDVETLSEQLSPPVQSAVDEALILIENWILQNKMEN